jgi:hypothetical protein
MGVMKENFFRNAHDTTFSPTGLYNFVNGSELVDSSGNSKTLTQDDAATVEGDFIEGEAEGVSHFTFYRNNTGDFNYTGAMTFCCLINTKANAIDSTNKQHYLVACEGDAAAGDALYGLQITRIGGVLPYRLSYLHQNSTTYHRINVDTQVRSNYEWSHVAFTRDSAGTGIKIYLNGQEIKSGTTSAGPGANGSAYMALGSIKNYSNTLNETVVQTSCAIYNQELTANQIKYLARKTLGYHSVG